MDIIDKYISNNYYSDEDFTKDKFEDLKYGDPIIVSRIEEQHVDIVAHGVHEFMEYYPPDMFSDEEYVRVVLSERDPGYPLIKNCTIPIYSISLKP
jgi:hypothetical protein